ncbi:MAG: choice-of-anchor R domain-containing protein [Candidatus Paceibacterota bacterium]|jgi:hypothetical protein
MKRFVYQSRAYADVLQLDLDYKIKKYSRAAVGGPKSADIEATGNENNLYRLLELLRCPVVLYDNHEYKRWWGMISEVTVQSGAVQFGVSIDSMKNKIAVAYTIDNIRYTTAWSSDADSTAEYGIKELLLSKSKTSESMALQARDTQLQSSKYPIGITKPYSGNEAKAIIKCKSWLETLDWRYYLNNVGKEFYDQLGTGGREIGEDDRPIAGMSFQILATVAWDAVYVWLHAYKHPSDDPPVDNLQCAIYSDVAGSPGVSLASGSIAAADLETNAEWVKFTLSVAVTLNPGTTYWIVVSRSGAVDADSYFMVDTNRENGYPRGSLKLYSTVLSAWVDREFKGDMNFIIEGSQETTSQISDLITNVGQFFAGTHIDDASGVFTNQYRDGDSIALDEFEKLLECGTTNDRRLLCDVTDSRYLRLYEEPTKPTDMVDAYKLDRQYRLYDPFGNLIDPSECKAGVWCAHKDIIPDSVDLSKLANPSPFFIEEAEYNADKNEYKITKVRDQDDVFEIGGVEQG